MGHGLVVAGWGSSPLLLVLPQVLLIGLPLITGLCLPQLHAAAAQWQGNKDHQKGWCMFVRVSLRTLHTFFLLDMYVRMTDVNFRTV